MKLIKSLLAAAVALIPVAVFATTLAAKSACPCGDECKCCGCCKEGVECTCGESCECACCKKSE